MKKLSLSILASLVALSVSACDLDDSKAQTADTATANNTAEKTAPAKKEASDLTFNDKVAVSMGYFYGQNIAKGLDELNKEFSVSIDKNLIAKSFNEAINGKEPALSEEDMQATMQEFDQIIRKKAEEKRVAEDEKNLKAGQEFLEKNKANEGVVVTDSGLQYKIITKGTGATPTVNDTIRVTYRGTTIDGNVFDESKQPVEFKLSQVVKGWIEAFQLFPVGTKATLYIPANLAYGDHSPSPAIPNNAVLIFDVELLDIVSPENKEAK